MCMGLYIHPKLYLPTNFLNAIYKYNELLLYFNFINVKNHLKTH